MGNLAFNSNNNNALSFGSTAPLFNGGTPKLISTGGNPLTVTSAAGLTSLGPLILQADSPSSLTWNSVAGCAGVILNGGTVIINGALSVNTFGFVTGNAGALQPPALPITIGPFHLTGTAQLSTLSTSLLGPPPICPIVMVCDVCSQRSLSRNDEH